ncbi:hypothetical protein GWI33_014334 [Rhynchophorus ferrugineus]|uniref:Uncharacterized protein n=1 Tax=Rhynchophorus ferrugineus TaxID=354439 RepID=A0A834I593_RHYFE|nr:hypothetical protein GWI33_014334 [Rhynchophorus ferrugineus]
MKTTNYHLGERPQDRRLSLHPIHLQIQFLDVHDARGDLKTAAERLHRRLNNRRNPFRRAKRYFLVTPDRNSIGALPRRKSKQNQHDRRPCPAYSSVRRRQMERRDLFLRGLAFANSTVPAGKEQKDSRSTC